ncbi:MAG: MG2 domain-containing protein [Planctomycetaceae bacterium]
MLKLGFAGSLALAAALLGVFVTAAAPDSPQDPAAKRRAAEKLSGDGNVKAAFVLFRELALSDGEGRVPADALSKGLGCLRGLDEQRDAFVEEVVAAHSENPFVLRVAGRAYQNAFHEGTLIAGEFTRGNQRGGGERVSSVERDRVRSLQLFEQAIRNFPVADDREETASLHIEFAEALALDRIEGDAWRLAETTDLATLPDFQPIRGYYGRRFGGRGFSDGGAPVAENGEPIFYTVPESYETASSDGERWRWALAEAKRLDPKQARDNWVADFLRSQFGVTTLQSWSGWSRLIESGDGKPGDAGPYAVHTLSDDETIAKLATGVKRFTLPEEFNFLRIYQNVAKGDGQDARYALERLASIYEDRRQFPKAAERWKEAIERFGPGEEDQRRNRLQQITGNWIEFENVRTQVAGKPASVTLRFRNGKRVDFTAKQVKFEQLIADAQAYLQARRNQPTIDREKIEIEDIGHRLVRENETKYLGETVATWQETLDPPKDHFDARVSLETPLKKAGVYLLTAKMVDGNESRVLVWLTDTAIVRKPVGDEYLYFVADAATGAPVSNAVVEFFGWDLERADAGRRFITTSRFGETTDTNGLVTPSQRALDEKYQWLVVANTKDGRFAHLGFDSVWYDDREDEDYRLIKAYLITDRPVYRPDQSVKYKVWVRQADFARDWGAEMFASKPLTVEIVNPRGETIFNQKVVSDENGGVEGSYDLPLGATLGTYSVRIKSGDAYYSGGGTFRVEEYKKPEYEVTVDAPTEPVMLGEPIAATITAKYYFGSPVTNAQVHYKVTRAKHEARWYPVGRWDWFYGRGYWWFAPAREWYPGFVRWGCFPPLPPWYHGPSEPPEVVAEVTVPIGDDGTVKVKIDTAIAKELFGDSDHRYEITAEVTDASRRTITGTGSVFAPREPFQVTAWVDRGFYLAGDAVTATFKAQTIAEKPVQGEANVTLYRVTYDEQGKPTEKAIESWKLEAGDDGEIEQTFQAADAGQYRIACTVTDAAGHAIEGGYLVTVLPDKPFSRDQRERAESDYRYNALELTADRREYRPGETAKLLVAAERSDATVLLFVRPENGSTPRPQILKLSGKAEIVEIPIEQRDMPNMFVEALTISDGEVHTVVRELFVPPEERIVNVEVLPSKTEYKPGEDAGVKVKLTGEDGKPVTGEVALTMYDRSVEYISGGSNVPEIREFFWKWRREYYPQTLDNLGRVFSHLAKWNEAQMQSIGAFGHLVDEFAEDAAAEGAVKSGMGGGMGGGAMAEPAAAPMGAAYDLAIPHRSGSFDKSGEPEGATPLVEATIRSDFADTALWEPGRVADENGIVELNLTMPENLTAWKIRAWAMGEGTKVGEATAEVVTRKNLLVRMQAPRFFTETDEVVLSANVHNYLESDKQAQVSLELEGETLAFLDEPVRTVTVPAGGEVRVDWRVKAANPGEAIVTMKALTDEESDAMRQTFPVNVHGILRTESYTGTVRPDESESTVAFTIPEQRRINDSLIEVRFSPSLAAAMVDALPYLADYPYGCTEQSLNRFVPTVITQNVLKQMGVTLAEIRDKRTNLNPQEIGAPGERGASAPRVHDKNPVFDEAEVAKMADEGLARLLETQSPDGGWGWFPGGQSSSGHMTALVVHGLMTGKAAGLKVPDGVIERGVEWLKGYQQREIAKIKNSPNKTEPYKMHAGNLDAFVHLVLTESGTANAEMESFLYRDRQNLSLYALAMYGLALEKTGATDRLDMVVRNLSQFVVEDDENGTAYLRLPNEGYWWFWYGSEVEANAYYLKLLSKTDPKGERAPKLVKYLLNNRRNATYWNSTRDTAIAIEAMAAYLAASGEAQPNMTVAVLYDGEKQHEVTITAENLFSIDNTVTIVGDAVEAGEHTVTLRKKGEGPLYWNAYVTVFTQEDFIKSAGLEVKVDRKVYKLTRKDDATANRRGSRGQSVAGAVEVYDRTELNSGDTLASGDLVEVELIIESKNDYEYLAFEDMKAAGFEPVEVQSGYTGNSLGAYMELRDEKVAFFVERLPRGTHSVKYRLRAEIPGSFSALPAKGYAMYAPELRGNSDELKVNITD